jgi:hypothetical protein
MPAIGGGRKPTSEGIGLFGRCDFNPLAGRPRRLRCGDAGGFVLVGESQRLQLSLLQHLCLCHHPFPRCLDVRKNSPNTPPAVVISGGAKRIAAGLVRADFHRGAARFYRDGFARNAAAPALFLSCQKGNFSPTPDSQRQNAGTPAPRWASRSVSHGMFRRKKVDFETQILPIFKRNCLACHNATDAEGDLVLETPGDDFEGRRRRPGGRAAQRRRRACCSNPARRKPSRSCRRRTTKSARKS